MPLDWSDLPGIVAGGVIAAGAGWLQARSARRDRREEFAHEVDVRREDAADEVKQRRADDAWNRSYERAQEIVAALEDIRRVTVPVNRVSMMFRPTEAADRSVMDTAVERIRAASIYLPSPTRSRVQDGVALLTRVDELSETNYIEVWARTAGTAVLESIRRDVGRYLRQEQPSGISDSIARYLEALVARDQDIEEHLRRQMDGEDAAELTPWQRRLPEAKKPHDAPGAQDG